MVLDIGVEVGADGLIEVLIGVVLLPVDIVVAAVEEAEEGSTFSSLQLDGLQPFLTLFKVISGIRNAFFSNCRREGGSVW
jgi:hypothetical protein